VRPGGAGVRQRAFWNSGVRACASSPTSAESFTAWDLPFRGTAPASSAAKPGRRAGRRFRDEHRGSDRLAARLDPGRHVHRVAHDRVVEAALRAHVADASLAPC
jgi:hypothetical protein